MSIIEKNALLRTSDNAGNGAILYPVTRLECVIGLEEKLENFVESVAYLDLKLACIPASTNVALAGVTVKDSSGNTVYDGAYGSGNTKRIEVAPDASYTVSFTNPTGFSLGGNSFTFTTTSEYEKSYEFSETFYALYGFKIDENEADPFERVSYYNDNANFSPVFVDVDGDGTADEGDWASFIEHLVSPVLVRISDGLEYPTGLNRSNQKYDSNGDEVSYSLSSSYSSMVKFTKLWCRKSDEEKTFEYAFCEFPGSSCWTWANGENTTADYIYMAMYKGYINSNGYMMSYPFAPPTGSTTTTQEIDACTLNGDYWYPRTHLMHNFLEEMTWLLGKSTDCQTTFGADCTGSNEYNETGATIENSAFWGSSDSTKSAKFLYIENPWGNRRERIVGQLHNVEKNGDIFVKPYPPYNFTGENYVKIGETSVRGYSSKIKISDYGNYFEEVTGSTTSYYCDFYETESIFSNCVPYVGGIYNLGKTSGISTWYCQNTQIATGTVGASPHYIPPPTV